MLRWAERVFSPSGAERERGRVERGGEKPRGRGLGQRNLPNVDIWLTTKIHNIIKLLFANTQSFVATGKDFIICANFNKFGISQEINLSIRLILDLHSNTSQFATQKLDCSVFIISNRHVPICPVISHNAVSGNNLRYSSTCLILIEVHSTLCTS